MVPVFTVRQRFRQGAMRCRIPLVLGLVAGGIMLPEDAARAQG